MNLKLFRFVGILTEFIITMPYRAYYGNNRYPVAVNVSEYCVRLIRLMNIEINLKTFPSTRISEHGLYIANHLSWIDILVISSIKPMIFVTSKEIENTFFLGLLSKSAGCFFTDRRNPFHLKTEITELSDILKQGVSVCVFPEATSGDGSEVKSFHRALFLAAVEAKLPVIPLCLNYTEIDNREVTILNRDRIFWYGQMTFFPSLLRVLKCDNIRVTLSIFSRQNPADHKDLKSFNIFLRNLLATEFKSIR